jgi:hypothetical protein
VPTQSDSGGYTGNQWRREEGLDTLWFVGEGGDRDFAKSKVKKGRPKKGNLTHGKRIVPLKDLINERQEC